MGSKIIIKISGFVQKISMDLIKLNLIVIFFIVCLVGSMSEAASKVTSVTVPKLIERSLLDLIAIENDTDGCEFQIFQGSDSASAFVFPHSTFHFGDQKSLPLSNKEMIIIKSCKGSFLPVFIALGGDASGEAHPGFDGPFYISMWLAYPQVPETSKTHVRCMIKSGSTGKIGVKIGNKGDYRFVAYEGVHFIA